MLRDARISDKKIRLWQMTIRYTGPRPLLSTREIFCGPRQCDNEYMAHIYGASPKNYLKAFLFISGYHGMVKRKIQGTILEEQEEEE